MRPSRSALAIGVGASSCESGTSAGCAFKREPSARGRTATEKTSIAPIRSMLAIERARPARQRARDVVQLVEDAGTAIEQCATFRRERDVTRGAREELHAQLVLELADRLADGGRGHVRGHRAAAEASRRAPSTRSGSDEDP